ncbi:hypothetical protein E2C01_067369 [Portunus trituberculatus]|uniref:Uncharacterized protein n=1 Tax=Portunus trituberculatus TaxID=210409 RepID=A0A5B7HJL5_PORTR|nr:hypothetical protein [Portunus trituberculatus]
MVYTRKKAWSCRPSPKHKANKSLVSVRRWSTSRQKSGTGVPTSAHYHRGKATAVSQELTLQPQLR